MEPNTSLIRTHEPSLRELTSELEGLEAVMQAELKAVREIMDERDRRYNERAKAQDTAVSAALAASERASSKAEAASERRFEGVNEFRGTVQDIINNVLNKMVTRAEFEPVVARVNQGWGVFLGVAALLAATVAIIVEFARH